MLVLTRKSGESIIIGDEITVTVVEIKGNSVRLGIEAPLNVRIFRKEIYDKIRDENILASKIELNEVTKISEVLKKDDKV